VSCGVRRGGLSMGIRLYQMCIHSNALPLAAHSTSTSR